jgi:hypothetical protein
MRTTSMSVKKGASNYREDLTHDAIVGRWKAVT